MPPEAYSIGVTKLFNASPILGKATIIPIANDTSLTINHEIIIEY